MDYAELKKIMDEEGIQEGDPIILEIQGEKARPFGKMTFVTLTKESLRFMAPAPSGCLYDLFRGINRVLWEQSDFSNITKFEKIEN